MKKPKIVIFDEENNSVVCEEPMTLVAFICNEKQVKTVICGRADDHIIKNLASVSSDLILNTQEKGEKNV